MPQDLKLIPRPPLSTRDLLSRYKSLLTLASLPMLGHDYIPCVEGESPAILQNRIHTRLGISKQTCMFRWSVRQKRYGVVVRKVGEYVGYVTG